MADAANSKKRKRGPVPFTPAQKRGKFADARAIQKQTTDRAFENGELRLAEFVQAREFEIKALEQGIKSSKHALTTRAFQEVPRDLRRRTASHNVRKVPKRLQRRAAKEMAEDNTPTVASRRRKPTPHQRLRLDIAKRLQTLSRKSKRRRQEKKEKAAEEEVTVKPDISEPVAGGKARPATVQPRKSKVKTSKLRDPPVPKAKFRKRQIDKAWLPTHLWHAKRAHMTPPSQPLWRFAIPLSPTNKVYRVTHRASTLRGAVAWDSSYMATIGLHGPEKSILGLLNGLSFTRSAIAPLQRKAESRWLGGSRLKSGWCFERDTSPKVPIAPITVLWNPPPKPDPQEKELDKKDITENGTTQVKSQKPARRRAFIRVHPSAFLQVWQEVVRLGKVQKPAMTVEDLRFEIGSIQITGPNAGEALNNTLWPVLSEVPGQTDDVAAGVFTRLLSEEMTRMAPKDVVLSFPISDPRLHHPPRMTSRAKLAKAAEDLNILCKWPVDGFAQPAEIFDRRRRQEAVRLLPSQKSINRRIAAAVPGKYPEARPTDPQIPVMLYSSHITSDKDPTWTVLVPWKAVDAVWRHLMYVPLPCGGQVRFGGLYQQRQLSFESGVPWFPADYPGTKAGDAWEAKENDKKKTDWERRPKNRRINYKEIPLGKGRTGEIGVGWACDWPRLLQIHQRSKSSVTEATEDVEMKDVHTESPKAHHLPRGDRFPTDTTTQQGTYALTTVRIHMVARGVPQTCARIYRLPFDSELRERWLATDPKAQKNSKKQYSRPPVRGADPAEYHAYLAASANHDDAAEHPPVPDDTDLIGFVTTGNFNLGEGSGTGVGSILVDATSAKAAIPGNYCVVRNSGDPVGRLARYTPV